MGRGLTVAAITGDCEKYSIVKNPQSCRQTLASHTDLLDVLFLQIVIKCTTLNTTIQWHLQFYKSDKAHI